MYLTVNSDLFQHGSMRFCKQTSSSAYYNEKLFLSLMEQIRNSGCKYLLYKMIYIIRASIWIKESTKIIGWSEQESTLYLFICL